MRLCSHVVTSVITASIMLACASGLQSADAAPRRPAASSYYPHWVSRDGNVTNSVLRRLAPGTTIAVHHAWDVADIKRILNAPGKHKVSWYIEANIRERNDPAPIGMPVLRRIAAAKEKQAVLRKEFGPERFANFIELDGARDKYEGSLRGRGNGRTDWINDARSAKSAGFRYVAKSPTFAHVKALRKTMGADFVPHIVFEDVTASLNDPNPGYRSDAKSLAAAGEPVTLIIHEGAYGGFPATPLEKAKAVIKADFNLPNVEAYFGRASSSDGFVKLKSFAYEPAPDPAPEPSKAPAVQSLYKSEAPDASETPDVLD